MVVEADQATGAPTSGIDLATLLADCLHELPAQAAQHTIPLGNPDQGGPSYAAAREAFLAAGIAAVHEFSRCGEWIQFNIEVRADKWAHAYAFLADAARTALERSEASNFFFMHKPPGLRVRFQLRDGARAAAPALIDAFRQRTDLFTDVRSGVYEPESYLFGGPRSMPLVHDSFTVDSLAWLDQHVRSARSAEAAPDWAVSLALVRAVVDGLGIVGWEHRGVWDTVRRDGGRRLAADVPEDRYERFVEGVRAQWDLGERALQRLPGGDELVHHRAALVEAAQRWRREYFESEHARTGPRRAAAFWTIFHWNRARIPISRQCLLTDALLRDGGM
ncbi:thiopeptide-type bacteriocin biosynthesis protein [Bounagaea algeriensis]